MHAGAEPLAQSIRTRQLELLLEPGTVTREKQGNEPSTLDLTLSTPNLTPWIIACKVIDDFHGSDHRPIETTIAIGQLNAIAKQPRRRNFKKANIEAIVDGAKWLQLPYVLGSSSEIDTYASYLVAFIQDLIDKTVPYCKASLYSQPWWTQAITEAVATERRARRHWTQVRTEDSWNAFLKATDAKRQRIASAKRAHWRQQVHEAAISKEGIWKLAKWARTKSHLPLEPPKMPDLQWQGALHTSTSEKANALYERFYLIVLADIGDIVD